MFGTKASKTASFFAYFLIRVPILSLSKNGVIKGGETMLELGTQTENPAAAFDLFQQELAAVFRQSGNGEGALELARFLIRGYHRDRGRQGDISFVDSLTLDEKRPLGNLSDNIRGEILGLVLRRESLRDESHGYLMVSFERVGRSSTVF